MRLKIAVIAACLCLSACSTTPSHDNDNDNGFGEFLVRAAGDLAVDIARSNDDRPRELGAIEKEECRKLVRCESVFEAEIRRERESREAIKGRREALAREEAAALQADFGEWMTRDETPPELTLPASLLRKPIVYDAD